MKRQELQKMKKLAGLLKEELDVSWNPYEYNYQYQAIQSLIAKKAKEYFKEAGLDPDGKYEIYRRTHSTGPYAPSSPKDFKTIDEAAKEFINKIKTIYSDVDQWIANMNAGIEHDWISDHERYPDDEVDMDDYDEETEEVHNEEELANQVVVNRFKSSYTPNKGVILSNSAVYSDSKKFNIQISEIPEEVPEEVTEDLDVSWNPYSQVDYIEKRYDSDFLEPIVGEKNTFVVHFYDNDKLDDNDEGATDLMVYFNNKKKTIIKAEEWDEVSDDYVNLSSSAVSQLNQNASIKKGIEKEFYWLDRKSMGEALDVSWNPYSEEQQEHCLLATKCVDSNIQQNLYMNHGEINNPETNKKEIKRLLWPEAKKVKGDGYDMYYYFNDMIDAWFFVLDLSPKSSNYEKAVETITSPGGVMFSSGSDQLLELCKQMIITLNPILDKEVFKWR